MLRWMGISGVLLVAGCRGPGSVHYETGRDVQAPASPVVGSLRDEWVAALDPRIQRVDTLTLGAIAYERFHVPNHVDTVIGSTDGRIVVGGSGYRWPAPSLNARVGMSLDEWQRCRDPRVAEVGRTVTAQGVAYSLCGHDSIHGRCYFTLIVAEGRIVSYSE